MIQSDEGSSKEKNHVVLTIRDRSESSILQDKKFNWDDYIKVDDNRCIFHDYEGYDWSKHSKEDGEVKAMVAKIKKSREEIETQGYLDSMYDAHKEARQEKRWDSEYECYVDPKGNPTIDPNEVDFEALVAVIPTVDDWYRGLREIRNYREKLKKKSTKSCMQAWIKRRRRQLKRLWLRVRS
ncbi:hypothetical protein Hanom_Chr08g00737861 [Helianthus anomalus]